MKKVGIVTTTWVDEGQERKAHAVYNTPEAGRARFCAERIQALAESENIEGDIGIDGAKDYFDIWKKDAPEDFHRYISYDVVDCDDEGDLAFTIYD